jgi:endoglucanase
MNTPSDAQPSRLARCVRYGLPAIVCALVLVASPASAATQAAFTSPANGQTGVDATPTFTWSTAAAAQNYYLTVGTSTGAYDLLASGELPASQSSYTSPLTLPTGRTLYARIYTKLNGAYANYQDITFTAAAGAKALFTSPTDGMTAVEATEPLKWSKVAEAQGYVVMIGTTVGGYDVMGSGELPATASSFTPWTPLPTGKTLYARLYTKVSGAYSRYHDISFTAVSGGRALFTSPSEGQPADMTAAFTWSTATGAQNYYLTIGRSLGANDVLASGELPSSQTSYTSPLALPTGTLYARIYTKLNGAYGRWQDISFQILGPALPALTVSTNKIMAAGQPFHFYGVNRDSLEWGRNNWTGCGGDGNFADVDYNRIKAWKVSAVRIPLSQAGWLGRSCDAATYMRSVDAAVAKANARGMYAIVDLHWSDVSGRAPCDANCVTGQQPMPDAHSIVFWRQVAARYANRPGVIFDLYNEPYGVSWSCWRNGGCSVQSAATANGGTRVSYTVAGMQQLLDTIRGQGANNLVLAAGLDWAYDLSGIGSGYALSGANVAYDTHVYTKFHSTAADWDAHFGFLAATKPVTATEFGSNDCSTNVTTPLLNYFQAKSMSWTIWSWNNPGSCQQPSLLSNMDGTPLAGQGQLIHDRLATLGG